MHLPAATWVHLQYMLGVDWMSITLIWNGFVIAFLLASLDEATAECAVCGSEKSERILTRSSVCWIRIARPLLLLPSTSTWQPGAICHIIDWWATDMWSMGWFLLATCCNARRVRSLLSPTVCDDGRISVRLSHLCPWKSASLGMTEDDPLNSIFLSSSRRAAGRLRFNQHFSLLAGAVIKAF